MSGSEELPDSQSTEWDNFIYQVAEEAEKNNQVFPASTPEDREVSDCHPVGLDELGKQRNEEVSISVKYILCITEMKNQLFT